MVRTRIEMLAALGLMLALATVPSIAAAAPSSATVVSTRAETVNGVQVAEEIVKTLDRVAVGSSGATVTLDVAGTPHDIGLDVSQAGPSLMTGKSAGIAGLAMLGAAAAGFLKMAAVLVRLFR